MVTAVDGCDIQGVLYPDMPSISLAEIRAAQERITPYIRKTPLLSFDSLGQRAGKKILLKCENLQHTGSFKIRGASNCILGNLEQAKKMGVTTASAGNHAQGVAAVCHRLGIKATVVMPAATPTIKVLNTQKWGATVELVGAVLDDAYDHAMALSKEKGFVYIHPFRDQKIMAGQGTIGLELVDDPAFDDIEAVVVSLGGGGLISGIGNALKALRPGIKVYGVAAKNAPATWRTFKENKPATDEVIYTLAEGVAAKKSDEFMLGYLKGCVDDVFTINEEAIANAVALLAEHGKMVVEGAGALPVSAIIQKLIPEKNVALVLSGGNMDLPSLSQVLQRGLAEQGRLVRLVITIPDRPGGLHSITQVLAEKRANILQVFHQRATLKMGIGETEVEVDLETKGREHTEEITKLLTERGFRVHRDS